ncbi:TIGR00341 family protein [Prochlorococcus marinus]|uniref:TIGR00341 family protein n=1 Tax=Prochlorococcus marinus TaxID=1219 RepID=UPI001F21EC41|nr:TIGR00341 family protein [Prochlorococcus marinus]
MHRAFDLLTGQWSIFLEQPVPIEVLDEERIANSLPSFGFFVLLITSTIIATFGLIANNTAVVIGAMIVAPLMNPILSMAYGISIASSLLIRRSLVTLIIGTGIVVITAALIATCMPVRVLGSEILARTSPNLIDLLVAFAAGIAGAFSLTRKRIASSIAGVAIAVALVPPLCVSGIGLTLDPEISARFSRGVIRGLNHEVATGSFILFLANLIGITFAASLTFLSQSYGSIKRSWRALLAWLALIIIICVPLSSSLRKFLLTKKIEMELSAIGANQQQPGATNIKMPGIKQKMQIRYMYVNLKEDRAVLDLVLNVPEGTLTEGKVASINKILFDSIKEFGIRQLDVDTRIVPSRVHQYRETLKQ